MPDSKDTFYKNVSDYYDNNVEMGFEDRVLNNVVLDRMRNDFREITVKYPFRKVLEIGSGPGFDIEWFASTYPNCDITGIDISSNMTILANNRLKSKNLKNGRVVQSDERELTDMFKPGSFDLIYVYFGALNTVPDLAFAAEKIYRLLSPGGHVVLTFVNKWYMREMIVQIIKLNFKIAFARLKKDWGGYSPYRHLASRCYTPKEILSTFNKFEMLEKKGYSIYYPAWYNAHKLKGKKEKEERLWRKDQQIQNSFLWSKGEYTLFVLKKVRVSSLQS